jgi:hypothetical protein
VGSNRVKAPGRLSEERSHFRGDVKCEVASKRQEDRIDRPSDGYRLQRHEYEDRLTTRRDCGFTHARGRETAEKLFLEHATRPNHTV